MPMRNLLTLALILSTTAALAATVPPLGNGYGAMDAPRDITSVGLAQKFCDARVAGDMSSVSAYFAPKLARLLDEYARSALANGVPWQSYVDRPTRCSLEVVNNADDTIGVLIKITYASANRTWSDTLNLERTPDSWMINNVFYEGGGNLRFKLFAELGE
jgi:hypothetical protein